MYLEEDLVYFNVEIDTKEELFLEIEKVLVEKKYAVEGLGQALIDREKDYPTGLALDGINIAIAHTDPKYSLDNKICIIKPKEAIEFQNIENSENIDIDFIFVLLLKNSDDHLKVLKTISSTFLNNDFIVSIKQAKSSEELFQVLDKYINNPNDVK